MASRTNHPLKTLFLLAVVAGIGWGAYEFLYVRGILRPEVTSIDAKETRERVRELIMDAYEKDLCLYSVDEIAYRANEDHFRIRITLSPDCHDRARELSQDIVELVTEEVDESVGVFAYAKGGNLLAKFIE